jgi:hypothetical protein
MRYPRKVAYLMRPSIPMAVVLSMVALTPAIGFPGLGNILPHAGGEAPVTTSINDTVPVAGWMDGVIADMQPQDGKTFHLAPGYYRFTIRSYCLHAGTYGPTDGDGYLLAPLKGGRAGMIRSILQHSVEHPEIEQHDVQQLIWDIEAGAKFQDLPHDFAARIEPLLSPSDIAALNLDTQAIMDRFMPDGVRNALDFYNGFRAKLLDPASSFQDLEKLAVLTGDASWGKGSRRDVKPGNWSYMDNGFYIRTFPENYSTTVMEVFNPSPSEMRRDDKGRIVSLKANGYETDATYDDAPGRDVISTPGQPDVHIWRFKTLHFIGSEPGEDYTIQNRGWVVPDDACSYESSRQSHQTEYLPGASSMRLAAWTDEPVANSDGDPTLAEYNARILANQALFTQIRDYVGQTRNHKTAFCMPNQIRLAGLPDLSGGYDMGSQKNFQDGMKAATNPQDLKGKGGWIAQNVGSTALAFGNAISALAGFSSGGNHDMDPSGHVSTPANTAKQRLAMSAFSK